MSSINDINVSLEPHLLDSLEEIYPVLPQDLKESFSPYITSDTPKPHIPYTHLQALSRWARSPEFSAKSPGINPNTYTLVSLLAGTMTSPERKLGTYVPPPDPEEVERRQRNEKKAITTLVNAVLSIGCAGAAAWAGSGKTGWSNEWRALFSMFAAILVATAEAGLYLIYLWRRDEMKNPTQKLNSEHKKDDSILSDVTKSSTAEAQTTVIKHEDQQGSNHLRQRK
ncbi:hypothetical protein CPB83DRAFT_916544 [Crepidotus variabilis]|uniref:Uncharacterized protein n=1 Tax=Crepidotus variabilis TaxID=179855 RepID=A0A9P6EMU1_9AGAR|nr:hypothetical protein CPB83DRAFT_916544 [Crepidotus variabilis]